MKERIDFILHTLFLFLHFISFFWRLSISLITGSLSLVPAIFRYSPKWQHHPRTTQHTTIISGTSNQRTKPLVICLELFSVLWITLLLLPSGGRQISSSSTEDTTFRSACATAATTTTSTPPLEMTSKERNAASRGSNRGI